MAGATGRKASPGWRTAATRSITIPGTSRPSSLRARASRSHRRQVWIRYQHRACPRRLHQRQAPLQALASLRWRQAGSCHRRGNLWIGGQQVWLGPAPSRRHVTLWADAISLHVLLDGTRIKTLSSRLGVTELSRLAASGARGRRPASVPADHPVRALLTDVDRAQPHKALFSAAPALPPPHGRGSVKQATPTGDPHQ